MDERSNEYQEAEEGIQENGLGIQLDFDTLTHRNETTTSLSDLYGVPVFTETFSRQVEQFNRRQRDEMELSFERVLFGEQIEDLEPYFLAVFQAEREHIIRADHQSEVMGTSPWMMVSFGTLGMVLAGVVLFLLSRIKGRKQK